MALENFPPDVQDMFNGNTPAAINAHKMQRAEKYRDVIDNAPESFDYEQDMLNYLYDSIDDDMTEEDIYILAGQLGDRIKNKEKVEVKVDVNDDGDTDVIATDITGDGEPDIAAVMGDTEAEAKEAVKAAKEETGADKADNTSTGKKKGELDAQPELDFEEKEEVKEDDDGEKEEEKEETEVSDDIDTLRRHKNIIDALSELRF